MQSFGHDRMIQNKLNLYCWCFASKYFDVDRIVFCCLNNFGRVPASYLYSVLIRKIFTCKENIEIKWATGPEFYQGKYLVLSEKKLDSENIFKLFMLFDYWLSITLSVWALNHFAYSPVWSCSDYRCNHQTFVVTKQLSHKTFDFIPRCYGSITWLFAPIHNVSNVILACLPSINEGEEAKICVYIFNFISIILLTLVLFAAKVSVWRMWGIKICLCQLSSAACHIPPGPNILLMLAIKSEILKLFQAYKISMNL